MRVIADLEIHSRFARAVSKEMNLANLEAWGLKKGIDIIGTGDFTHPTWFDEISNELEEVEPGLYQRKASRSRIRFIFSAEISCIFSRGGATRRIHVLVYAPNRAAAFKIINGLGYYGNLRADGRPIIGIDIEEVVKIAMDASPDSLIIPAHVWTPWFGMYGSKSRFDSITDCFPNTLQHVPAVETGLSSDPPMNWRLSELDDKSIVSFSDAHSPPNIGREATIFELASLNYNAIADAIRLPFPKNSDSNRIVETIEFFPEEGMYHWDGHREHHLRWSPAETKKHEGRCTVCGKPVTVGVMNRVDRLADRPEGYADQRRPPFRRLVPLAEIIGEALGLGKLTKGVTTEYEALVKAGGSEFRVLLDHGLDELRNMAEARIVEGIRRVRDGQLHITPGYDGVYGTVHIFGQDECTATPQASLF